MKQRWTAARPNYFGVRARQYPGSRRSCGQPLGLEPLREAIARCGLASCQWPLAVYSMSDLKERNKILSGFQEALACGKA